jgi:excisionase family DNA binding protein
MFRVRVSASKIPAGMEVRCRWVDRRDLISSRCPSPKVVDGVGGTLYVRIMNDSRNTPSGRFVDRRVVARMLGLSSETIRRMVARGELPAYRVAGRLRFDTREIRDWLVQR